MGLQKTRYRPYEQCAIANALQEHLHFFQTHKAKTKKAKEIAI